MEKADDVKPVLVDIRRLERIRQGLEVLLEEIDEWKEKLAEACRGDR